MKFSLILSNFVLLTLAVTAFAQETNQQNPPGMAIPGVLINGSETPDSTGQEQDPGFPQPESDDGPNQLIPGGTEDNQQIITGEGEGGNVERPKRFFWPVFRNNHYYYEGRAHHHYNYRRYCRHSHRHCYNSPYYHCENICDNWGYWYY